MWPHSTRGIASVGAMMSDSTKIGTSLLGLGLLFLVLGVFLLFDRFLLSMGNVMFLAGLLMTMGVSRSARFFRRSPAPRATSSALTRRDSRRRQEGARLRHPSRGGARESNRTVPNRIAPRRTRRDEAESLEPNRAERGGTSPNRS